MKFLIVLLIPLLVACGSKDAPDTAEFDKYLEQLMAEPYDPENGSIY